MTPPKQTKKKKPSKFQSSISGKYKYVIDDTIRYLKDQGWSNVAISGVLGNMAQESEFNPAAIGPGGFSGTVQMSSDMAKEIKRVYGKVDYKTTNQFIHDAMSGNSKISKPWLNYMKQNGGYYGRVFNSASDAAMAFGNVFERPNEKYANWESRTESAEHALQYLNSLYPENDRIKLGFTPAKQFEPKSITVKKQVNTQYPIDNNTPISISSWSSQDSPAYKTRVPSVQEINAKNQKKMWDLFDEAAVAYGKKKSNILPSLDQLMSYGKEQYIKDITGAPSIYDNAQNNPTINKFLIPILYANKGRDLPGHRGGNDLVQKYDKFVENDPYYIATALSYLPIIGTAMDIREAVKNPTAENIGYAALSGITDLVGGRLFAKVAGNIVKAKKTAKAVKKAELNHWRNTPFYQSMPKEQAERTVKNYAQRAADEVLNAANTTGEFMPEARLVPAASVYFPDFMANVNQHKHNKGKDLPKYAPGKDDEQVERGGITYNVHPSALTEKEMLNVEVPNTNVRSTPGMLRAREIRNENARKMAEEFLAKHPFGPNTLPVEPGLELTFPEFEILSLVGGVAGLGTRTTNNLIKNNLTKEVPDAISAAVSPRQAAAARRALSKRFDPEELTGSSIADDIAEYYGKNYNQYPTQVKNSIENSVYPRMREMRPWLTDNQFKSAFNYAADGKYTAYPVKTFQAANGPESRITASYYPDADHIAVRAGRITDDLGHEIEHKLDEAIPLTKQEDNILSNAYKQIAKDERKTTNYEARKALLGPYADQNLSILEQNKIIDAASDEEIFEAVAKSNGYGYDFMEALRENDQLTIEVANAIRQAMKKVGAYSAPIVSGAALYNSMQNAGILAPQQVIVDGLNNYNRGKDIYIKPSKRGTFTAAAKKHGKSVQAFASQVLANPGNYSSAMRKKAQFARNAKKWEH